MYRNIIALLMFILLTVVQAKADDSFSIYGIDFSLNAEQVMENLLERDFKVWSSFVPIHLKGHVNKTDNRAILVEYKGFPFNYPGIDLTQDQERLVSSNESALMTYKIGKFKVINIRADKEFSENNPDDRVILELTMYTDIEGNQHILKIAIKGNTVKNIIMDEFAKRYGKPRILKIGYSDVNVWKAGKVRIVIKMSPSFEMISYEPEVIEKYISFCAQEIQKIINSQNEERKKEMEEADTRRKNIF